MKNGSLDVARFRFRTVRVQATYPFLDRGGNEFDPAIGGDGTEEGGLTRTEERQGGGEGGDSTVVWHSRDLFT